jgi:DNA repair exonuclease SbcCD nuclease subunit
VTRFFHAADVHVDSPLRGLDRYEGAPVERLRGATRRALENLVTACIEERVAFLLLAGDVFDGAWKDYSTGLFFCSQMTRLREAGIAVVLVRGNHDAQSEVVKALRLPDNVEELSAKKPESFGVPGTNVVVHGQSFAKRITSDDLAARYPDRQPGAINVGLLHTSVDGREGHEPYAPTSIATMRAKGYDYWLSATSTRARCSRRSRGSSSRETSRDAMRARPGQRARASSRSPTATSPRSSTAPSTSFAGSTWSWT